MSNTVTHGVRIEVVTEYVPEKSDPEQSAYFFAYHVTITNEGDAPVQLLGRHWEITNALGHVEEVEGAGVVGEQPTIEPGESFEYTSFCPINTSRGSMKGTYQMATAEGEVFDAVIASFHLTPPRDLLH